MRRRQKGLTFYHKRRKVNTTVISEILKYISGIAIAVFLAFSLTYFVGIRTSVIGDSMEPTLSGGQEVLINRFIYMLSRPRVGDVIVFRPNGNANAHLYVKRVVARAGDTVRIEKGILYVNDKPFAEDCYDLIQDPGIAAENIHLGVDEYFVLGDSVNDSDDSRSGNIGPIREDYIEGKVWFMLGTNQKRAGFVPSLETSVHAAETTSN